MYELSMCVVGAKKPLARCQIADKTHVLPFLISVGFSSSEMDRVINAIVADNKPSYQLVSDTLGLVLIEISDSADTDERTIDSVMLDILRPFLGNVEPTLDSLSILKNLLTAIGLDGINRCLYKDDGLAPLIEMLGKVERCIQKLSALPKYIDRRDDFSIQLVTSLDEQIFEDGDFEIVSTRNQFKSSILSFYLTQVTGLDIPCIPEALCTHFKMRGIDDTNVLMSYHNWLSGKLQMGWQPEQLDAIRERLIKL